MQYLDKNEKINKCFGELYLGIIETSCCGGAVNDMKKAVIMLSQCSDSEV